MKLKDNILFKHGNLKYHCCAKSEHFFFRNAFCVLRLYFCFHLPCIAETALQLG